MEPFNGNPGLDDEVYICGEACEFNSYSAVFSDEGTIADGDLSEWIRGTNWGLYAKLRRMPLTSSGELVEALKVDPERTSIPIINTGDPRANPRIRQAYKQSGPGSRSGTRDNRLQQPTGSQGDIQKNKSPHLQTLRSSMIGPKVFSLHLHSNPDHAYYCSRLTCRRKSHSFSVGDTFGSVADNQQKQDSHSIGTNAVFYCYDCLDQIMDEYNTTLILQRPPNAFDGAVSDFRGEILQVAEKLHPGLEPKTLRWMYFPQRPPFDHGVESNSRNGLRLRRQKQYDIERIVKDAEEVDRWHTLMLNTSNQSDSLVLSARLDLPPYREQYRKQGLEWADRSASARDSLNIARTNDIKEEGVCRPNELARSSSCFCREMPDHGLTVQCSSRLCMFGQIHLRCSGLDHIPLDDERYYCGFCRDDIVGTMNSSNAIEPIQSRQGCTPDNTAATHEKSPTKHSSIKEPDYIETGDTDEEDQEFGVICREAPSLLVRKFVAVNDVPAWSDDLPLINLFQD